MQAGYFIFRGAALLPAPPGTIILYAVILWFKTEEHVQC